MFNRCENKEWISYYYLKIIWTVKLQKRVKTLSWTVYLSLNEKYYMSFMLIKYEFKLYSLFELS